MADIEASVANSFGYRSIHPDLSAGRNAARTAANGAIESVDDVLNSLRDDGADSLSEVSKAITALGKFKPGAIAFTYDVPGYEQAAFKYPSPLESDDGGAAKITLPDTGRLDAKFSAQTPPSINAPAPPLVSVPALDSLQLQTVGAAPLEPTSEEIAVPEFVSVELPGSPTLTDPIEPVMAQLGNINFTIPTLPTFTEPQFDVLPEELEVTIKAEAAGLTYKRAYRRISYLPGWAEQIKALAAYFSGRLAFRDEVVARSDWAARGHRLEDSTYAAQKLYRQEMAALSNAEESWRSVIEKHDVTRAFLFYNLEEYVKEWRDDFELNKIGPQKLKFDFLIFYINTYFEIFKTLIALFNLQVTLFNMEMAFYKIKVESAMADVQKWRAEVEAEIAKTKLNDQLAKIYATSVQTQITKASMYEAKVQAMYAAIGAYRSRMEAFAAQADVARAKLTVFKGKVEAYTASLTSYKAQFAAYEAQARGTSAKNQLQEAKTKVSIAEMQAAGAEASVAETTIQIDASALKLDARVESASYEQQRLANLVESIVAQVQGDESRKQILNWSADILRTEVGYDAVSSHAQAAARYYNTASDSAYRASEQAFRAMMSAVQASNIAQEAASRSAASVAQGAYSAIHVNAGLQGSGRISADESYDTRDSRVINDWLDFRDSRESSLSG